MDRRRAAGALLALAACFACSAAAPTISNQTSLDLYDAATEGCYYNFQHYGEGDRIMTNEPCLNCTCHNRMLMCYLRVCPFTKPIGQDCTVEKRADQCCPIVTCPDVPVDLLTSTSTTSPAEYGATGIEKLDRFGCSINGKYFPEGSKVPPTPNKPCEHCYCIRNMTTCVMQECTLHVDGCIPIYHKDVCCPVRYSCDHPENTTPVLDDMSTTVPPTPGFLLTTTTVSPVTQITQDCVHNDQIFADGTSIKTEKACEHCYCMKGDIVCVVQECGTPMENEGKNCTSQPPREGQCCPDTYICEGDELTTDLPEFTTQIPFEELTTILPPRRVGDEGSGYRHDDKPVKTEIPSIETDIEGSGGELETMFPLDVTEKHELGTISPLDVTEKQESETRVPLDVTEKQESETRVPLDVTEKQESETRVPLDVTEKYEAEAIPPSEVTKEHELEIISPLDVTEKPKSETKSPLDVTEKPESVTLSALDVTEIHEPENLSPLDVTDKPELETISPIDVTEKQVSEIIPPLHVTEKQGPEATTPSDITEKQELETMSPLDFTEEHEPEAILPSDVTEKPEPETMSPVDITEKQESETMPPLGVIEKQEQETKSPLDVTEKSESQTLSPLDVTEKHVPETLPPLNVIDEQTLSLINESFASTEKSHDLGVTGVPIIDIEKATVEPDSELNTVPSGGQEFSETSVPKLTTLAEGTSEELEKATTYSEHSTATTLDSLRTTKESILHTTESAFRKEDEPHEPAIISTETSQEKQTTLEPLTSKGEIVDEERGEVKPVIDDESKSTMTVLSEITQTISVTETSTTSGINKPIKESADIPTEHIINEATTLTPDKSETTTAVDAQENEIEDFATPPGPGRIPGEGDCLQNGITYRNYSSVPSIHNCKTDCKCINSIINCDPIICSPPPEYMSNCVPTYDSVDSCCPTYICDGSKETLPPQPHSQMSETESSSPTPSAECRGDQCDQDGTMIPIVPTCTLEDCSSKPSHIPEQIDCESGDCGGSPQTPIITEPNIQTTCGPTGCGEISQTVQHEPSTIHPVNTESCVDGDCKQESPEKPCEGESCKTSPTESCSNNKCEQEGPKIPCEDESCKISPTESCSDGKCKQEELDTPCEGEGCKISPTESCSDGKCKQTEVEIPCEGKNCKTSPTATCQNEEDCKNIEISKLDTPCDGDSCKNIPVDCSGADCKVLPPVQQVPDICDGENCKKHETDQKCTDSDCKQKDIPTKDKPSECRDSDCELQKPESPEQTFPVTSSIELLGTTPEKSTDIPSVVTDLKQTEATLIPELTTNQETDIQTLLAESDSKETDEIGTGQLPATTENQDTVTNTDISKLADITTKTPEFTFDAHTPESTVDELGADLSSITQPEIQTELPTTQISTSQTEKETSPLKSETTTVQPPAQDQEQMEDFTKEHELESTLSTNAEELTTSIPKVYATEQYDSTKISDQELPQDLNKEITPSPTQEKPDKSDLEPHVSEDISKIPAFTTPMTTLIQESGLETTEFSSIPEKTKLPEVSTTEYFQDTTESSAEHVTEAQPVSEFEEKLTTELPFTPSEYNEVGTRKTEEEKASTENGSELPIDDTNIMTIPPEISEISQKLHTEIPITEESAPKIPQKMQPDKLTTQGMLVTPDFSTERESVQTTTEKERETIETSRKPEEQVTVLPSIPSESESSETETPTNITDTPEDSEDKVFTEQPEIDTEEPSIVKQDETHEGSTPQDLFDKELPGFIPVHPSTYGEKAETERPGEEVPAAEVTHKDVLEHITSTGYSIDSITLEPVTEVTEVLETGTKAPEHEEVVTNQPASIPDQSSPTPQFDDSSKMKPEYESTTEDDTMKQTQVSSESTLIEHEISTESTVQTTKKEEIEVPELHVTDNVEVPESHVKDTDEKLPETEILTTEKQSTEPGVEPEPTISIMEEPTEIPQTTEEAGLETKTQKPETEPETSPPKVSEQTTESYEYSETTPETVELVEHNQTLVITTLPPVITISSEKATTALLENVQEPESDEQLTAGYTPESQGLETESPLEGQQPVTDGYEHKLEEEVTTKQADSADVDHKPETSELDQKPILYDKTTTVKSETPDYYYESTPTQESSSEGPESYENEEVSKPSPTEKPEAHLIEQEVPAKEILTEKPEFTTRIEELSTERIESQDEQKEDKDTFEQEPVSVMPESLDIESAVKPDKAPSTEVSDTPEIGQEMIPENEFVTEEPKIRPSQDSVGEGPSTSVDIDETVPDEESPVKPTEPSKTAQEDSGKVELVTSTPEEPETEHKDTIPEELVTKQPVTSEIINKPMKESYPKPTKANAEYESTTEKESYTSKTESPIIEKETIPGQESITSGPEPTDTEKKQYQEPSTDVPIEKVSDTEQDKESSTRVPETTEIESHVKPQEESAPDESKTPEEVKGELPAEVVPSTEEPKTPHVEHTTESDKDYSTERSDALITEHVVIPDKQYLTESPELEFTQRTPEKEPEKHTGQETPQVEDLSTEQTEPPEAEHKDKLDQDFVTKEPEMHVSAQESTTTETVKPEKEDAVKPEKEPSTEKSETSDGHPDLVEQDIVTLRPELIPEHNVKPDQESDDKTPETPEIGPEISPEEGQVTGEPETLIEDLITRKPEVSDNEIKPEIEFSTERSEKPETELQITSKAPEQEEQTTEEYYEEKEPETSTTKSKPTEENVIPTTMAEISSSAVYQTTITAKDESPAKPTEPSVLIEKPTSTPQSATLSETDKEGEDKTTLSTPGYPSKEEATTVVISETEKSPVPETNLPIQPQHEFEKPIEVDHTKDTTAPEEEFLTVTTKATTPKIEEETSTQSSSYDAHTKPQEKPQSESLPSATAVPEIPKPGFSEAPATDEVPVPEEESQFPSSATGGYGGQDNDYEDENQPFGPGTCRYGGKVYVSAQQIPRDDPCDFCFCFRSDIICLQQSCPPPIHGCHEEPIQGFCCPRYECPVSMASTLNITTTTTTTTTTLPPHFPLNAYHGAAQRRGCQIKGHAYKVGEVVRASSGPCLHCTCGGDGQMKCDPKACTPEPMLRQMIAAAVSAKRRR